ncbi:MAG: molybdenum cofactor biosynthesis protein MoaE [Gammaproteobacteria bacterium]|nr:molybdenum cofactor biosynthesis protein MoaE [Gammaproteobacteria bacterium]MDD9825102.1 molybdenum cofactor biosynthesis protein MoaE [Gammaproteobacteria bacterium]
MRIELRERPFDEFRELASQQSLLAAGSYGACALFSGSMRDLNDGEAEAVERIYLEHYPGMTEDFLRRIAGRARERWELRDALLLHRVGEVVPGESIVLIAVWARHRAPAFAACRFLLEELKARAPFWKKEYARQGGRERWVGQDWSGRAPAAESPAAKADAEADAEA